MVHANFPDSDPEDSDIDDSKEEKGFVNASLVKPDQISSMERAVRVAIFARNLLQINVLMASKYSRKKKAGLAALGEWKHINCLRSTARGDVQDDILRKLLHTCATAEDAQPSVPDRPLLDCPLPVADLEKVASTVWTVRDVPGGTVSFLFERSSVALALGIHDNEG